MISIAICSHDRSEDVALCLSALASQLPMFDDELIIVDSCSAPSHAEALRSLASAYQASFVRLETAGHSRARNAVLAEARGEWVAYLDDDAVPFPDWLRSLHKVIDNGGRDLAAVGGLTQPAWPDEQAPKGISPRWLFYLSCIQDKVRRSTRDGAKVCGANLAFRKGCLKALGGFRNELGRIGDRLIGGEETMAVRQLLESGCEAIYDPSVRVKHRIPRERLSLEWIRKRAYWEGVTETTMAKAAGGPFPKHLAMPKLAASAVAFCILYLVTRDPDHLIRSQIARGALVARLKPLRPVVPVAVDARTKAHASK
jgi:glycosyltransferase involved in cell wall biosynthesis